MNFLPTELEAIIVDYKNQMEKHEEQYEILEHLCIPDFQGDDVISKKITMAYQDFKDFYLRNWLIQRVKIKVGIYNKPKLDNAFYELNMRTDDDEFLNNFDIIEICVGFNTIHLDFGDYERNESRMFGENTLSFTRDITEDISEDEDMDLDEDDSEWETWLDLV